LQVRERAHLAVGGELLQDRGGPLIALLDRTKLLAIEAHEEADTLMILERPHELRLQTHVIQVEGVAFAALRIFGSARNGTRPGHRPPVYAIAMPSAAAKQILSPQCGC
jgi:hypothetical protein